MLSTEDSLQPQKVHSNEHDRHSLSSHGAGIPLYTMNMFTSGIEIPYRDFKQYASESLELGA